METIVFGSGLETIARSAFSCCTSLRQIELGSDLVTIGTDAFSSCESLTSITLPETVATMGPSAFAGCSALASISIPDGVKSIEESTFRSCDRLETVILGSGVEVIKDDAFMFCHALDSIDIPDGVRSIGGSAFSLCNKLETVILGSGVETIGDNAFEYCEKLTRITSRAMVPPVCGTGCFTDIDISKCTLNVPEEAEEAYKTADVWKDFFNSGPEPEDKLITSDTRETGDAEYRTVTVKAGADARMPVWTVGENSVSAQTLDIEIAADAATPEIALSGSGTITAETISVNRAVKAGEWAFMSLPFAIDIANVTVGGTAAVIDGNIRFLVYDGAKRASTSVEQFSGTGWVAKESGTAMSRR